MIGTLGENHCEIVKFRTFTKEKTGIAKIAEKLKRETSVHSKIER